MSRPAILGDPSASPSGKYLYSVGISLEAGGARREVLRSGDLGATWCVLPTPEPVSEVMPSPANELVVYALACETERNGAHLLESSDGGASWTAATALPEPLFNCRGASERRPTSLLGASTTDPDAVWLTRVDFPEATLYSSFDRGKTWSVPRPAALIERWAGEDPLDGGISGILVDPATPRRLFAWGAVFPYGGTSPRTLRYFVSEDAGADFREVEAPPLPGSDDFRQPPTDLLVDAGSTLHASDGEVLVSSRDWGRSWSASRRLPTTQGRVQALDPLHGGRLFSWSVASFPVDATVWKSEDGGTSWRRFPVPLNPALDPVLELATTGAIVGVDIFGLSTTTDGGRTWTEHEMLPAPGLVESPVDRRIWAEGSAWTISLATRRLPA